MSTTEFIVELLNASSGIVAALAWPVVVLVVFFFCMHRFGFLWSTRSGGRRGLFSPKSVHQLLDSMESQCVIQGRLNNSDRQRIQLIQYHVGNARQALLNNDQDGITASLVALSGLAASSDRHLKQAMLPDAKPVEMSPSSAIHDASSPEVNR